MESLSQHYHRMVGLNADWSVTDVKLDVAEKMLRLTVEYVGQGVVCPDCGTSCAMKDHAAERSWRHLDAMQFQTILTARVPRSHCNECGVKTIAVPWSGKHSRFTLLFEAFAIEVLLAASSIQSAAELLRIDWSTAQEIMKRAVERGLQRRSLEDVRHVGIDEKSFGKGQDYVSVMTDLDASRVLEVSPDRTIESANQLWSTLSESQRKKIQDVCMDMWQAYESSTEANVPKALIVHDRFHISKYLNEAVDKVRRLEHRELKESGDDRLKGMRQTLLFNPENLSGEKNEELAKLRQSTLATGRAWSLKELFRHFWDQTDAVGGREFFDSWYAWAIRSRLEPVKKVARMLKDRLDRILTWFTSPISNGPAEGFNSRIQSIKSAARGFRLFQHYRIRVLFLCGKLSLKPQIL
ncbi:MAG: ISL3 family transposase [Planctomycetaceae bacterium]